MAFFHRVNGILQKVIIARNGNVWGRGAVGRTSWSVSTLKVYTQMNGILLPSEWHSTKSNKYPEMENLGAWRSWEDELVG